MPKRKNAPKAPPASVEDRRDRNLRVVHREEMTATVGDVLEHLHTDAAIELLYAQDNLAAGRDLNDPTALMGEPVVTNEVEAAKTDDSVDSAVVTAEKTGTPAEQLAATIVTEAGAVVSEAVAAASVVTAAATSIAEKVSEAVAAVTAPKLETPTATTAETETASAARDRAREENAAEARVGSSTSTPNEEPMTPAKPASMLRLLSPRFVIKATREAVGELIGGVRQARTDLRDATVRARQCFVPTAK